jgi:hypothetical protein
MSYSSVVYPYRAYVSTTILVIIGPAICPPVFEYRGNVIRYTLWAISPYRIHIG